ncbi:MAG: glycosyltransferase [Gemmatimonadetes bacterium]|nr:glycosyltransferase [Gemmatimonadota bacterium]
MNKPIRVFHLIKGLGRGGAEMLLPSTLRQSNLERFTYGYGYFLPWKDAAVPDLAAQGAEVVCFEARNNLQILLSARRVAAHLRRWGADVLHCHLPIAGVVGRTAGKLAGVPVVYTEHGPMENYHPATRMLNLLTWHWQKGVVAVSQDAADSIHRHTRSEVPVRVVLNGVDTDYFCRDPQAAAELRAELGVPEGAPLIGTIVVFRAQKALHQWLHAARRLRDLHRDARFVIVGDGPLREPLQQLAGELGLDGALHFAGLQHEVRPYLSAMDLYLMSSDFEGLPVALLEALSIRLPVVSTAVGGFPELIESGRNGLLVPPGDPGALADAVTRLLADGALRESIAAAGRRTVEERFSVRRMVAELESLYEGVLARNGNGH